MRFFVVLALYIGISVASNARHAEVYFKGFDEYWFDANNEIQVTFALACHEQLLHVIRQETYDVESGITTIHLGALVERNWDFCNENYQYRTQSFSAGFAYSGIAFRIDEINNEWDGPIALPSPIPQPMPIPPTTAPIWHDDLVEVPAQPPVEEGHADIHG